MSIKGLFSRADFRPTTPPQRLHPKCLDEIVLAKTSGKARTDFAPPYLLDRESVQETKAEDRKRARTLMRTLTSQRSEEPAPQRQREPSDAPAAQNPPLVLPDLPGRVLLRKLRQSAEGQPVNTLASSTTFRRIRRAVFRKLFTALAGYTDDNLRIVTLIKSSQRISPIDLFSTRAKKLKAQFFADVKRAGIASMSGPLVAFLHGEFEPTEGVFVIHWHLVTTAEKAGALKREFQRLQTYGPTPTGSPAIFVQEVRDRDEQLTYLLKSFWPMKAVREIDGTKKRDRTGRRIEEPYGSLALLWLDRQKLRDLCVLNDCWSLRNGGPPEMRALYRVIFGDW